MLHAAQLGIHFSDLDSKFQMLLGFDSGHPTNDVEQERKYVKNKAKHINGF